MMRIEPRFHKRFRPGHFAIMRLVIDGDRVMLSEPLPLGRIRDFVFTETGVMVASRAEGVLVVRNDKSTTD
jgi:hypothetical protein